MKDENNNEKKKLLPAEMEIIRFDDSDVITTSGDVYVTITIPTQQIETLAITL